MPNYDYECKKCKHITEKLVMISKRNEPQVCEKCGGATDRLCGTGGVGTVFKGKGFYQTDYKHPKDMKKQSLKEKKAREEGTSGYTEV